MKRLLSVFQSILSLVLVVVFIYAILHYENRHWMLISGILGLPFGIYLTIVDIRNYKNIQENEKWMAKLGLSKAVGMVIFSSLVIIFFIRG